MDIKLLDMMLRTTFLFFCCHLAVTVAFAQRKISLLEAIDLARQHSLEASITLGELRSAYWSYHSFRATLLPEVRFKSSLPDYNRGYNLYQNDDGSYRFVRSALLRMNGEVSIEQSIPWTGGRVSLNSSLQYIDPSTSDGSHRNYLSLPIGLTIFQPLWATNHLKWKGKLEPLKYREAQVSYLANMERITLRTIESYFELLLATESRNSAKQNQEIAKRIAQIAEARREMGQISENESMQYRQAALKAASEFSKSQSLQNAAMFRLRALLLLDKHEPIEVETPDLPVYPQLSYSAVLSMALKNNPYGYAIRRRILEADYEVAKAKGERLGVELFFSFGYTGREQSLPAAYRHLMDNQVVQVGVAFPLVDWGKRKYLVRKAEANRDAVALRMQREEIEFEQSIFFLVEKYNNQAEQLRIAIEADHLAQQRYDASVASFMLGKISALDLNDALQAKDTAHSQYISDMHLYWHYLYQIRSLTLFDFVLNRPIDADFESIVNQ